MQIKCLGCVTNITPNNNRKFCSKNCKRNYFIKLWLAGKFNSAVKNGDVSNFIRRYLMEINPDCSVCHWVGINQFTGNKTLQIDHVDGDRKNGYYGNLVVLCPNCHSLTKTWGALNIKKNTGILV